MAPAAVCRAELWAGGSLAVRREGLTRMAHDPVGGPGESEFPRGDREALERSQVTRGVPGFIHDAKHRRTPGLRANPDREARLTQQLNIEIFEIVGAREGPVLQGQEAPRDDPLEDLTAPAPLETEEWVRHVNGPFRQIRESTEADDLVDGTRRGERAPRVCGLRALHAERAVVWTTSRQVDLKLSTERGRALLVAREERPVVRRQAVQILDILWAEDLRAQRPTAEQRLDDPAHG